MRLQWFGALMPGYALANQVANRPFSSWVKTSRESMPRVQENVVQIFSEELEKAATVSLKENPIEGGDNVLGSIDSRFGAGLPFLVL